MKHKTIKLAFCIMSIGLFLSISAIAQQTNINGPAGSSNFGQQVVALPNGNIVVTDPNYSTPGVAAQVGAVYLYNGSNGTLISTLTGSTANDQVGSDGVTVLTNGNYVVRSSGWNNGATQDVGAVTFGNATTGISGVVSSTNSLVGSTASDAVGNSGVTALTNGNYVVRSPNWDRSAIIDVGAATFGNGTTGITGAISQNNSLIGLTANDQIGDDGVTALSNGNYVVRSPNWDNGGTADAGAATFGDGTTGITGAVSPTNSLVGSTANDRVSSIGIAALTNGNYVVSSHNWDNGGVTNVGAVTFGNGTTGITGAISPTNSLIGSTASDLVGINGVTALTNGNYVVRSPNWDNSGMGDAGAATFGNGTLGITGAVSTFNSLVGSTTNDRVGTSVTALTNGNYVVNTPFWDNGGTADVGATTFANGTTGITGTVSPTNSLIGSTASDFVGFGGVTPLTNGNYVVSSSNWDNGGTANVGAATLGDGTSGITGVVSPTNSLVGSTVLDQVSLGGVTALTNGNYVVRSQVWNNGGTADVGAATFGDGTSGITGAVSPTNSLVGLTAIDQVSSGGVTALVGGNYVVYSPLFDNGATDTGAITYLSGMTGNFAPLPKNANISKQPEAKQTTPPPFDLAVAMSNSVLGTAANGGASMNFSYDLVNNQLVVGRPADNIVTFFNRFAPTAASVSVSGKVTDGKRGLSNAVVTLTDSNGITRTARTSSFGYFRFDDVEVGQSYTMTVQSSRYFFTPQIVTVNEEIAGLNFTAN